MPKTNDQTGATAEGMEGIVEHGAPIEGGRTLSELDPERNLDGTLIEGEHPDRDPADYPQREGISVTDPAPRDPNENEEQRADREAREQRDREQQQRRQDAGPVSEDPGAPGKAHIGEGLVTGAKDTKQIASKGGEDVSAGGSSATSTAKTGSSDAKSSSKNR